MSKKRNYNEKLEKKTESRQRRQSNIRTVTSVTVISLLLVVAMLIMYKMPGAVVFRTVDGHYVDPRTGIAYVSVTPLVYEPKKIYADSKDVYGTMDGDKVYELEGVGTESWLARQLYEGLFTLYCAEGIEPPSLEKLGAVSVIVFEDDAVMLEITRLTDKDELDAVINEYSSGAECQKPNNDDITFVYNLRFESEKYPFLYYCVKFVRTESGDFYCSHENGRYYAASDVIGNVIDESGVGSNG